MLTLEQYAEKRQARYDRLVAAANKAQSESVARRAAGDRVFDMINGQPLLVDHYSYRSDLRRRERASNNLRKGYELYQKAESLRMSAKASQNSTAIFSDDPQATDKLTDKIAALEAKQELMKATNKAIKKNDRAALVALGYTDEEATDWLTKPMPFVRGLGYPAYAITNNGANIRRLKERAQQVERKQAMEDKTEEIGEIRIEYTPSENRIRIFYPGRVDLETYKLLKQHGYRVLRTEGEGAFSAYYNANALWFIRTHIKKES